MKYIPALLLLGFCMIITSGCSSVNPQAAATNATNILTTNPAMDRSRMGSYLAINEVGLGENGFVALTNFTDQPADLKGLYLCQGSDCFSLPDVMVAAGETVRIATGDGIGIDGVVASQAPLGELRPSDGEIALLTSQNIDDPKAMLLYFQWGSTPHDLTQIAIDAGLWVKGGYGPSSATATRLFKVPETGLWLFDEP